MRIACRQVCGVSAQLGIASLHFSHEAQHRCVHGSVGSAGVSARSRADAGQLSPMFPVVDLVYLSRGTVRVSGDVVTGAAFWSAAVMDLAVLVGWVAVGLMVIRRTFRWEPRQ